MALTLRLLCVSSWLRVTFRQRMLTVVSKTLTTDQITKVAMKLATRSGDLASTVMVPNSLGPGELLLRYGTPAQQRRWLDPLLRGDARRLDPLDARAITEDATHAWLATDGTGPRHPRQGLTRPVADKPGGMQLSHFGGAGIATLAGPFR